MDHADRHHHANQDSGTMTVIRVTKANAGGVITRVLKAFLSQTDQAGRWQRPDWQRFEVIGDFGEQETASTAKLISKLSRWAQRRCGSPGAHDCLCKLVQVVKDYPSHNLHHLLS